MSISLIQAVKRQSYQHVQQALLERQPLHMRDIMGFTALHWAAFKGDAEILELIVQAGANIDETATKLELSPLHVAAASNQRSTLLKLIDLGANKEAKTQIGHTPLDIAILINTEGEALKIMGKYFPAFNLADTFECCFKTIELLLNNGANISDMSHLQRVAINALATDRVSLFKALIERGFDYKTLNNEEHEIMGFDSALIFAASNCSIACLDYLLELDPQIIKPISDSYSGMIERNMISWVNQQLPEEAVFEAPYLFFASQQKKYIYDPKPENLKKLLPRGLQDCEVEFAYDSERERYYISRIEYGFCFLYFNEEGEPKNANSRLTKLDSLLNWYKDHNIELNCKDNYEQGNRSAQFTLQCPREIIEIFIRHGMRYEGSDLYWALRNCSPQVIDLLIDHCSLEWQNLRGMTIVDVLKSDDIRDELLDYRALWIKRIEEKLIAQQLTEPPVEFVPQFNQLSLSKEDTQVVRKNDRQMSPSRP